MGVDLAKKEGGLAGRAVSTLDKVLKEGMAGYENNTRHESDEGLWGGYIM
jgi:hypothetical protein